MCGIGGIFTFQTLKSKRTKAIAKKLLLLLEERGRSATGIASINSKNQILVNKAPLSAKEFVKDNTNLDLINNPKVVLLHTRLPTIGAVQDNVNNHPIFDKATNSVLVHNGMVDCSKEFECDGLVDSENILRAYLNRKDIKKALRMIDGQLAIALYSKGKLYLYAWNNPLTLAYIPSLNLFVFASLKEYIVEIFRKFRLQYGINLEGTNQPIYFREFNDGDGMIVDLDKRKIEEFDFEIKEIKKAEITKPQSQWAQDYYDGKVRWENGVWTT